MAETKTVAVIGGGVAGLTAAHELRERGFKVTVHEARDMLGGKARSFTASGKDIDLLPAEHGFRFFPSFYRHIDDTLRRIPGQHGTVASSLVTLTEGAFAQDGRPFFRFPMKRPRGLSGVTGWFRQMFGNPQLGLRATEVAFATSRIVTGLSMCDDRRLADLETVSWADYMAADQMSPAYRAAIVDGLTQNFVAMNADRSSTRSVINILARLFDDFWSGRGMDRILDGPTSEVWIEPWRAMLEEDDSANGRPGVLFEYDVVAKTLDCDAVHPVVREIRTTGKPIMADYFVMAVPLEAMTKIARDTIRGLERPEDFRRRHPSLGPMLANQLSVSWMAGIVLYLARVMTNPPGHVSYNQSTWALTSILQAQHWRRPLSDYNGSSPVRSIMSVIVSEFFRPGNGGFFSKPAQQTNNAEELKKEAVAQIMMRIATEGGLSDADIVGFQVDPDLKFAPPGVLALLGRVLGSVAFLEEFEGTRPFIDVNVSPLFINTVGSWKDRPTEDIGFRNLFLASDYVRTNADLATMEGANEAARRAVNAILAVSGSPKERCRIFEYDESPLFEPARALDQWLFDSRLANPGLALSSFLRPLAAIRRPGRGARP